MEEPSSKERLIVALDVPTADEALRVVSDLADTVSFYKIGLELLMSGKMFDIVERIPGTKVFLDLKLPADIPTTVTRTVRACVEHQAIKFLTLSGAGTDSMTRRVIAAAREGRGESDTPKLLTVPFLSSLDRNDFVTMYGQSAGSFESFLVERCKSFVAEGADGLIVSGEEIGLLRKHVGRVVTLVSPGIRPSGFQTNDHKRSTTPAEAIELGADYLVVGRPIVGQSSKEDRQMVAKKIVDEIASAQRSHARRAAIDS